MASSGRILGWTLGAVVLVAAAGLGVWMLGGDEPAPQPEDDDGVAVVSRPTEPREPAPRMELAPPPDRTTDPPPAEVEAPVLGAVTGRVTTADRRVMREGRVEAMRGPVSGMPGLVTLTSLRNGADIAPDGRFTIAELPPVDDLVLRVDGETFALTDVGNFVVRPGESIDLGDVIVSPGMAVTGRVVDERGHPVEGASVGYFAGSRQGMAIDDDERPTRLVLSDADGRFRIRHVPLSSFSVKVSAEGHANAMAHGGVLPGEQPASVSVLVTMRSTRPLRGRVVALPDGEPLAGARVRAIPLDPGHGGGSATSDEDGWFEIEGGACGNYSVEASVAGYSTGRDRTTTEFDDYEVQIELHKQGSLSGFVVGEDGKPIGSFDLQPQYHRRRMSPEVPAGPFRRITDSEGAFELTDLEPGFTCVQVWARGYALTESDCVRIKRGEDVQGVVVTLVRGAVIAGEVLDEAGNPVPGARVSLHRNREPEIALLRGTSGRPAMMKDTRTGSDGRFVLRDVTAMTYQVEVDHPDFAVVRRNDVRVEPAAEHQMTTFVLDRAARVEGVATAPNGQLQADSVVFLQRVGGMSRQTSTDGKGRFVFTRLEPGDYQLSCYGKTADLASVLAGLNNTPEVFRVRPGETVTRNVVTAQ